MELLRIDEKVPCLFVAGTHRGMNKHHPVAGGRQVRWKFDLYLYHDWSHDPTHTGKIPVGVADLRFKNSFGLPVGYGLRKPDTDGFSARIWFGGDRRIGLYYYHNDQGQGWGDTIRFPGSLPNRPVTVECMVDLDSGLIGGRWDEGDWTWGPISVGPHTRIDEVWYDGYYGGQYTAPVNQKADISNLLVWDNRPTEFGPTPEIAEIRAAVEERFDVGSLGMYNRRYVAGTTTWSQHAYYNAWDIAPPEDEKPSSQWNPSPTLDEVSRFLLIARQERTLPIRDILWRTKNHWDHIHVDGDPHRTGTPPIFEGEDESMKELTLSIQKALKAAGYDPGPIDGIPGPKTEAAMTAAFKAGDADPRLTAMLEAVNE